MGVELPWIFLFNHCYCKIADLVRRKGRFETKKQKDVRHDGTLTWYPGPPTLYPVMKPRLPGTTAGSKGQA